MIVQNIINIKHTDQPIIGFMYTFKIFSLQAAEIWRGGLNYTDS